MKNFLPENLSLGREFDNDAITTDVPFLNYLDDAEFLDNDLYRNAFFLNDNGASKFTKRVVRDLKGIEYLS